jgi:hypothetical protein
MNQITKVRNIQTGEIGWAADYGSAAFAGRRTSVFASPDAARKADVSDDVGEHVLHRHCDLWQYWRSA